MGFEKVCHVREHPATTNRLKAFGKPWNVKWMTLVIVHFKKHREPLLTTLNFITTPSDCIQASIMPFQTIFSLFYLSTNLDKFRKGSFASQSVELYNNLWYNSIRGDDE